MPRLRRLATTTLGLLSRLADGIRRRPRLAGLIGIGGLVLFAVVMIRWAPSWLADTNDLAADKAAEERGRVRTALLALLAGLVAVAGALFTGLSFVLSKSSQHIDRFTKAVEQLGNDAVDVRLGGIYALERLTRESASYRAPIIDVLSAYIRGHAVDASPATTAPAWDGLVREITTRLASADQGTSQGKPTEAPVDVKAAFSVLARRDIADEQERPAFDFHDANLRGIRAEGIHLEGAFLAGAQLERARLEGAHLQNVTFVGADLRRVRFGDADVSGASLNSAHLEGADLSQVKGLESATIRDARYDKPSTMFPRGFDPDKRGAIRARVKSTSGHP